MGESGKEGMGREGGGMGGKKKEKRRNGGELGRREDGECEGEEKWGRVGKSAWVEEEEWKEERKSWSGGEEEEWRGERKRRNGGEKEEEWGSVGKILQNSQIVSAVALVASLAMLTTNAMPAKHINLSLKDKLALELPLKHLVDEKSGHTHTKVAFSFAPPTTNDIFTTNSLPTDSGDNGNAPSTVFVTNTITNSNDDSNTPVIDVVTKTTATKIPSALIPTVLDGDDDTMSLSTTTTTTANTRTPVRPTYVNAALFRESSITPTTTITTVTTTPTPTTTTTTKTSEKVALRRQPSVDMYDYEGYFRVWDDLSPFGGELSSDLRGYPEGGFRPFSF
ncbi:hypothetical protein Pcinc_040546 [Petrolisthes cinctipes]|uniref:Uncharacterized protein n=1 Tax=Petrolisthes cinctipes TaxID=88211 RepID=A0AAE1BL86_PETCI|nr:hypothetical protein Pcinc_040546 [Petrolisthes cinctipes]